MMERSTFNPIPEGESAYNPIGNFSFGGPARVYNLTACRRCAAAIPEEGPYRDQHDAFHLAVDKLYEWAVQHEEKS